MKKHVIIDDGKRYEFALEELAKNITKEYASKILTDEEFKEFCKIQDAWFEEGATYIPDAYFPGCYGDALADC